MRTHVVRQGECLSLIAWSYGFERWETVYEAPENAEFRRLRPNPNVIYPGDELVIPDTSKKVERRSTGARHEFELKRSVCVFRLDMKDEEKNPIKDAPYELYIHGTLTKRDKTDAQGRIEVEIPHWARSGKLIFMGEEFDVRLGVLDPVTRVTGVQQRLNNLGYNAGPVDGIVGPLTRGATFRFQADCFGLENATGVLDDRTREKLLEMNDQDSRVGDAEEDMSPTEPPPSGERDDDDPCGQPVPSPGGDDTVPVMPDYMDQCMEGDAD
ncbi:MAG: peptidoglycan-binding protein [Phycisphaeraceae bacterium]|nr:peptidoglycan-binding protein [Phycisphaeraceae bacterium]